MQNNFDSPKAVISPICDLENVCDHWGKSKNTVYRWIRMGKFPAPFIRLENLIGRFQTDRPSGSSDKKAKGKSIHKSTGVKS